MARTDYKVFQPKGKNLLGEFLLFTSQHEQTPVTRSVSAATQPRGKMMPLFLLLPNLTHDLNMLILQAVRGVR
jgi:hypothetical protein